MQENCNLVVAFQKIPEVVENRNKMSSGNVPQLAINKYLHFSHFDLQKFSRPSQPEHTL